MPKTIIPAPDWRVYRDLMIYAPLLFYGLIVLRPKSFLPPVGITPHGFVFNDSTFLIKDFATIVEEAKRQFSAEKLQKFAAKAETAARLHQPYDDPFLPATLKKVCALASELLSFSAQTPVSANAKHAIFNATRRNEIYIPFSFPKNKASADESDVGQVGLWIHPWLSKNPKEGDFQFRGFQLYTTAICAFGATLRGVDQDDFSFPIIKHHRKWIVGQVIQYIDFSTDTSNPYESAAFVDLENLACFIDQFSQTPRDKKLLIHLPGQDYILFGLQLFVQGKITLFALNQFCNIIFQKIAEYERKIQAICTAHQIQLMVLSPFAQLFTGIDCGQSFDREDLAEEILLRLLPEPLHKLIPSERRSATVIAEASQEIEAPVIAHLIELLIKQTCVSDTGTPLNKTWQDLLQVENQRRVTKELRPVCNVEDLFKVANLVLVAHGAKGKEPYTTCNWAPIYENQTSVAYAQAVLALKECDPSYRDVFNITTFETMMSHSPVAKGNLFFFNSGKASVVRLIDDEILVHSSARISYLFSQLVPVDVDSDDHPTLRTLMEHVRPKPKSPTADSALGVSPATLLL